MVPITVILLRSHLPELQLYFILHKTDPPKTHSGSL